MVLSYPSRVTCQWGGCGGGGLSHRRIQVHPSLIESRHHWARKSGREMERTGETRSETAKVREGGKKEQTELK